MKIENIKDEFPIFDEKIQNLIKNIMGLKE